MKQLKKAGRKFRLVEKSRPEIPSDIIPNILSRLRAKACLKCKLVCKEWYGLITSREFADLRSSRGTYHYLTIMPNNKRRHFLMLELDKSSKVDEKGNLIIGNDAMITIKTKNVNCYHFVDNECNGLSILATRYSWDGDGSCYICNHITGELLAIDLFERYSPPNTVDFGFGCCPTSHQFKILRIYNNVARIQTLGSNEWRLTADHNAPPSYPRKMFQPCGAFLHGSLHRYSKEDNIIWCFDFGTERFRQVSTPDCLKVDSSDHDYIGLSVFNSCLCLCHGRNQVHEMWVMKEYGVKDSWVKQFVIEGNHSGNEWPTVPLFELGNGEILFTSAWFVNLKSYDTESQIWKKVKIPGISSREVKVIYHTNNIRLSKLQ